MSSPLQPSRSAATDPAPDSVLDAGSVPARLFADVLARFGGARLRLQGTSMLPAIWPGDVLEIVPVDPAALRVGDVVLFLREGRLFCHRVRALIADGEIWLRTRGDLVPGDDPPFPASAVLGRARLATSPANRLLGALLRTLSPISQRPVAWLLRWHLWRRAKEEGRNPAAAALPPA